MQEPQLDDTEPDNSAPQATQRYPESRQVWGITVLTIVTVIGTGVLALDAFGKLAIVLSETAIIVPALIFMHITGYSYRSLLRLKPIGGHIIAMSIVIGFSLPIVANILDTALETYFPMPESLKQTLEDMLIIENLDEMVWIVSGLVIGAAVFEELFFRGFLQSTLEHRYSPSWAIGLASLTFGLVHVNPWWFASILLAGVVCGLLAYLSGSVYPGIIVHGMNNGLSLLILNARQSERFRWLEVLEDVSVPTVLVSVTVLAVSLAWFVKYRRVQILNPQSAIRNPQ